ncbi:hypothetical protein [Nostoc sp.]|uniref:hypothetical protein n=1 Tax=Nostoc sp. TaxID=1180 RepID=UPI002FF61570
MSLLAYPPHYKRAFAFDPIFPTRCIRLAPSLDIRPSREQTSGYFVPNSHWFEPLEWHSPPGLFRNAWLVKLAIANPAIE